MPSYAGVAFEIEQGSDDFTPVFARESHVSRRKIPHGNKEDVQYGGKGNWRWSGRIQVDNAEDFAALEAASGDGVARTLTDFRGETISGAYLNSISRPESDPIHEWHRCEAEFEYGVA